MDNAIEVPNNKDVLIENACIQTFANEDGAYKNLILLLMVLVQV